MNLPVRSSDRARASHRRAFTLIEVLVVIGIISLLVAILIPSLSAARQRGQATVCLAHMHSLGQGLTMYSTEHQDVLVPGRLPRVDNDNWRALILGGWKFRPTFLAMMGTNVGIPAFDDPMPSGNLIDRWGEPGDKQNYASKAYVCPTVADWTDERNGSYGYNYQWLGNSRLLNPADIWSFKNWPVSLSHISSPGSCVAMADSMGTAANYPIGERLSYRNNPPADERRLGNEGFNLDPPRVDTEHGEAASGDVRSGPDDRHLGRINVLWVDAHASAETMIGLGYEVFADGSLGDEGNNCRFSASGRDEAWLRPGTP